MTIHDNRITFSGSGLVEASYVPDTFYITHGQERKNLPDFSQAEMLDPLNLDSAPWFCNVRCGRQGSEMISQFFHGKLPDGREPAEGAGYAYAQTGQSGNYDKMNFCFTVELTLSGGETTKIHLAQAHGKMGIIHNFKEIATIDDFGDGVFEEVYKTVIAGLFPFLTTDNPWIIRGADLHLAQDGENVFCYLEVSGSKYAVIPQDNGFQFAKMKTED